MSTIVDNWRTNDPGDNLSFKVVVVELASLSHFLFMPSHFNLRNLELFGSVMERRLEPALTAMVFGLLDIGGQVIMLSM